MNYNDEAKVDEQGRNNDQGFDFTKYLTDSQIEDIAKKVCEEELRKYMDRVFTTRSYAGISTADQIIKSVAETYAQMLEPEYKDDVIKTIKDEIKLEKSPDPERDTFRDSLKWGLQNVAGEYIKANSEALQLEMKNAIHEEAKALTAYKLSAIITKEINMQDIILKVLKDAIETK